MIQRVQSLYLSLITLLSVLFLKGGFLTFAEKAGPVIKITFNGIIRETSSHIQYSLGNILPMAIFIIFIPVLSVITIFLYKKRTIQLVLARILILFIIVFIFISGLYEYNISAKYNAEIIPGFKMVIPVLQLVLSILASRAIKKDGDLVKSYDRLR
jgi:hypothetical protein